MSSDISPRPVAVVRSTAWSTRYLTPTLVLLLLALVPTIVNSYVGRRLVETPALADALPTTLDGRSSSPTRRKATTIKREFASQDWVERAYTTGGEYPLTVLAVRSYDMKRLYHHPELAVTEHEYEPARLIQVPSADGPVNVHVLPGMQQSLAAYALIYRGETVASPYEPGLRGGWIKINTAAPPPWSSPATGSTGRRGRRVEDRCWVPGVTAGPDDAQATCTASLRPGGTSSGTPISRGRPGT